MDSNDLTEYFDGSNRDVGAVASRVRRLGRAALVMLTVACGTADSELGRPTEPSFLTETEEIVENLRRAGYPEYEIVVHEGRVFAGSDAVVTLRASQEIAGALRVQDDAGASDRQYSTNNLVESWVEVICVDGSSFYGNLSSALDEAIKAFNDQGLSFTLVRTGGSGGDCDAVIKTYTRSGGGGQAGFPSGGLPYPEFEIGTDLAAYPVVAKHVIMHELGHCIGFRHTDYYNRSISCGGDPINEGSADIGANHIDGTPEHAEYDGSVMNSCYNMGSNGKWTDGDVIALQALYGSDGGGGDEGGGDEGGGDEGGGDEGGGDEGGGDEGGGDEGGGDEGGGDEGGGDDDRISCQDRCHLPYDKEDLCHCDPACDFHNDCCDDKQDWCGAADATSCQYRCNLPYDSSDPCHCDAACETHNDCCADKQDRCG